MPYKPKSKKSKQIRAGHQERVNRNPLTGKPYNYSDKSVSGMVKRAGGYLVQDYKNYLKAVGGVAQDWGRRIRDSSGHAPAKKMKKTIKKIPHRESFPLAKSPKPKHI